MDIRPPRRAAPGGFFLHSEIDRRARDGRTRKSRGIHRSCSCPGLEIRVHASRLEHGARRRPLRHRGSCRRGTSRNQIRERDWQPSTGTLAPLIQLARADARNATTAPTSSGRPNLPNGSSLLMKSAMPAGSSCWRRCHEPPGNRIEPGATLLTRILSRANCWASDLARLISAALTALYVIRPPDSRPQIDAIITIEPPPRRRMWGTARDGRLGNRWIEHVLVEGLTPFIVRTSSVIDGAARQADVVDEHVQLRQRRRSCERPHALDSLNRGDVGHNQRSSGNTRRPRPHW